MHHMTELLQWTFMNARRYRIHFYQIKGGQIFPHFPFLFLLLHFSVKVAFGVVLLAFVAIA